MSDDDIELQTETTYSASGLQKKWHFGPWKWRDLGQKGLLPDAVEIDGLLRYTREAERLWLVRLAAHAKTEAAALARARRISSATKAAQAAVKSPRHVANRRRAAAVKRSSSSR